MDVSLHGDARQTLRELLPLLDRKDDREWRGQIEESVREWWQVLRARAMADAEPVNPQRVFWELSPRLPDRAILTADSGSVASWWARDLVLREGMLASLSGNLATMGPAVPYAIAAKLAYPDRPVIASVGDGAMQMIGNNELVTIAERYPRWPDRRLVIVVLNNGDLNMVTWEQRVLAGAPKFEASQVLPKFPYAGYARLLGLEAFEVDTPGALADAFDRALAADRPALVEVHTDPEVPPLPPHITWDQSNKLMTALIHGDPDRWRVIKQAARQMWATVRAS
jgi:pyruvate dehydrogenase (quinone)